MATTHAAHGSHGHDGHDDHGHHELTFLQKYVFSVDHKVIGMQYFFTGVFMGVLGALASYLFRMQMAYPGQSVPGFGLVTPDVYNALITNHGTIMIFWFAMPVLIAAFGMRATFRIDILTQSL
jgi:cytochrome c oxidase subunit 1